MVSFLIFKVIIVGIIILGVFYSFASDYVDWFIPSYSTGPLSGYNTVESDWGFDVLIFLFKWVLIPSLSGLMFYTYIMAQKPERPWR